MRFLLRKTLFPLLAAAACGFGAGAFAAGQRMAPAISIDIPAPFPQPRAAFEEAVDILSKQSYNSNLNDEIIYYSAIQGVLRQLSPSNNKDLLEIWPPEVEEKVVKANITGVVGSIGVRLLYDSAAGVAIVSDVIPGTPAERKGLRLRDRITAIDGIPLRGKALGDVLPMIQKPVGTEIRLALLRGGKPFDVALECEQVKLDDVRGEVFEGVGLIRIRNFSQDVMTDLAKQAAELRAKKVHGFILDLRNNAGGVFDVARRVAEQFLRRGATIFYTVGRDGGALRYESAIDGDVQTPVVVLVNDKTASVSETLAAALQDNKRAAVVGVRTKGKGTILQKATLKNGYTMTFVTDMLYRPNGELWQGRGIAPDKTVEMDPALLDEANMEEDAAKRLALDVQLDAAMKLLR